MNDIIIIVILMHMHQSMIVRNTNTDNTALSLINARYHRPAVISTGSTAADPIATAYLTGTRFERFDRWV
jgi:hypothetical protein